MRRHQNKGGQLMPETNMQTVLEKYMAYIRELEGTDYVDTFDRRGEVGVAFTQPEWDLLQALSEKGRQGTPQDGKPRKGDTIAVTHTDLATGKPDATYMRALRDFDPAEEARRFLDGEGLEKIPFFPDTNEGLFIAWAVKTGLLEHAPGLSFGGRTWVIDPLITPASDLAKRNKVSTTGLQLHGIVDDIDGRRQASVQVTAHRVQYGEDGGYVIYPGYTIEGLKLGTKHWILCDEGARRDEPTRYFAATTIEGVMALPGHRLLGTITTPN